MDGQKAMAEVTASPFAIQVAAVGYLAVGGFLIAAATAAFLRKRVALAAGIAAALAFVVDGFLANQFLFDSSRVLHDGANVFLATLIISLLIGGKGARKSPSEDRSEKLRRS